MSAAAARRRKQLAAKKASLATNASDPITTQLNTLLSPTTVIDESTAYEALQLAQSQLRKSIKSGDYNKATVTYGYDVAMVLLSQHKKASVASQLLTNIVQALVETHTVCDQTWIERMGSIHRAYLDALPTPPPQEEDDASVVTAIQTERKRLMRLHSKFLTKVLAWTDSLGSVRFGALELHEWLGHHCWALADLEDQTTDESSSSSTTEAQHKNVSLVGDENEEETNDYSSLHLRNESAQHFALAEQPLKLITYLQTLPSPTPEETKANNVVAPPPNLRESLLTRACLAFCAVSNLRDAHTLLSSYLTTCEDRDLEVLKKSYMSKTDGQAPSHVIFNSMLLEICRKDVKSGPLYKWLLKGFQGELNRMYKPDVLRTYTAKIGRVYFHIQPPPSMMSTLENMMAMAGGMGGMGGGMGGGLGGMNPAMMQAMMGGGGMPR